MTRVSVSELRRDFGKILERVESGEEFLITKHGKAVAVLVPFEDFVAQS